MALSTSESGTPSSRGRAVFLASQRFHERDEVGPVLLGELERHDQRRAARALDAALLVEPDNIDERRSRPSCRNGGRTATERKVGVLKANCISTSSLIARPRPGSLVATPMSWKLSLVNRQPLWQTKQLAFPLKSAKPRFAACEIAASTSSIQRSNGATPGSIAAVEGSNKRERRATCRIARSWTAELLRLRRIGSGAALGTLSRRRSRRSRAYGSAGRNASRGLRHPSQERAHLGSLP